MTDTLYQFFGRRESAVTQLPAAKQGWWMSRIARPVPEEKHISDNARAT
jgi:hypothetical protein